MMYGRRCSGLTLQNWIRNEVITGRMKVNFKIIDTIGEKQLIWYGKRINEEGIP